MRAFLLLFFLLSCAPTLPAQVNIGRDFESERIVPDVLRDAGHSLTIYDIIQPSAGFEKAKSAFFTFGNDPANWWLRFEMQNPALEPRSVVLNLNRKNFDTFHLYQVEENKTVFIGQAGANAPDNSRFYLTNGYHFNLTLQPGRNIFYASASNRIGSMHLSMSAHTLDDFQQLSRRQALLFGLFAGIMCLSVLLTIALLIQYRDRIYLLFLIYLLNIFLREAYNYSADFGLMPVFQRNVTSMLIAASFGLFFREFLRLKTLVPWLDRIVKWYALLITLTGLAVWALAAFNQGYILRYVFRVVDTANLVFTFVALISAAALFRRSEFARITTIAFLPLAAGFVAILLRNMNLVPNYPIITQAVMIGFIFEVAVFTFVLIYWYRTTENEREMLRLKLRMEQQEKQLAIQSAEQRIKDAIARDLHDDVAASMSGIRILSQVALRQIAREAPQTATLLEQISASAQTTLESISDLIWAVKPNPDYLNDIADRIRAHAGKVLEAKEIQYQFNIARDLPILELDIEKRRNLYLIFKEALNNAVKYSHCKNLRIGLHLENNALVLTVHDDGDGFLPESVEKGNGLDNMAKRALSIGAELDLRSAPGEGTTVRVVLAV